MKEIFLTLLDQARGGGGRFHHLSCFSEITPNSTGIWYLLLIDFSTYVITLLQTQLDHPSWNCGQFKIGPSKIYSTNESVNDGFGENRASSPNFKRTPFPQFCSQTPLLVLGPLFYLSRMVVQPNLESDSRAYIYRGGIPLPPRPPHAAPLI